MATRDRRILNQRSSGLNQLALELDAKVRVIVAVGTLRSGWHEGEPTATIREQLERSFWTAARRAGKELEVEIAFEETESAAVLAMHGEELDVLVLGSRGHGLVRRALLPGVSGQLARAAPCPVVVVRRDIHRGIPAHESLAASAAP